MPKAPPKPKQKAAPKPKQKAAPKPKRKAATPADSADSAEGVHQDSELGGLSKVKVKVEVEVRDENPTKPSPSSNSPLPKPTLVSTRTTRSNAKSQPASDSSSKKRTGLVKVKEEPPSTDPTTSSKKRTRPVKVKKESSSTTTTRKRTKLNSYAPPEKYAHLGGVTDAFTESLISVFIGLNPGIATATAGHAYAAPSNHFWRFLHSSGLTPDRQCPPETDTHLPRLYSLGNTNLVARPTKDQAELSKAEMDASVEICEEKIRKWRPESVCVVGKGIWESMWRAKHSGRKIRKEEFVWGWQVDAEKFGGVPGTEYEGARVFVVPSTSGLVAGYSMEFKRAIWKELGDWVQQRRTERGETAPRTDKEPKIEVKDEE